LGSASPLLPPTPRTLHCWLVFNFKSSSSMLSRHRSCFHRIGTRSGLVFFFFFSPAQQIFWVCSEIVLGGVPGLYITVAPAMKAQLHCQSFSLMMFLAVGMKPQTLSSLQGRVTICLQIHSSTDFFIRESYLHILHCLLAQESWRLFFFSSNAF